MQGKEQEGQRQKKKKDKSVITECFLWFPELLVWPFRILWGILTWVGRSFGRLFDW
ncbi:hypothetical protein [Bhargavaea beijingensis]|uniref:Uncharacterized protein n=1 Tax=Bhargavaea beijingensis TaxID=426756 RepID=A0A1G7E6K8_9BACL|nr:hypothetical protein [Bhargavaea beijingensis]SDE59368.1 hypothetical protein SAMN04488126_11287 [Bhargavaea beijingensis]